MSSILTEHWPCATMGKQFVDGEPLAKDSYPIHLDRSSSRDRQTKADEELNREDRELVFWGSAGTNTHNTANKLRK